MSLKLHRISQGPEGTFGTIYIDEDKCGVTVERPSTGDHPCIPAGTYPWRKFISPHNGPCLLLENVPDRSMIEIHSANFMLQLKGCIAPGKQFGIFQGTWDGKPYNLQGVTESKTTLKGILEQLPESGNIEITEFF